jgi:hypothetical protein
LVGLNTQLEAEARREAERLIKEAALERGILDRADENARIFMRSLLRGIGVRQVVFVEVLPTPTPYPSLTPPEE